VATPWDSRRFTSRDQVQVFEPVGEHAHAMLVLERAASDLVVYAVAKRLVCRSGGVGAHLVDDLVFGWTIFWLVVVGGFAVEAVLFRA
jgi:hypothetical protein